MVPAPNSRVRQRHLQPRCGRGHQSPPQPSGPTATAEYQVPSGCRFWAGVPGGPPARVAPLHPGTSVPRLALGRLPEAKPGPSGKNHRSPEGATPGGGLGRPRGAPVAGRPSGLCPTALGQHLSSPTGPAHSQQRRKAGPAPRGSLPDSASLGQALGHAGLPRPTSGSRTSPVSLAISEPLKEGAPRVCAF